MTSGTAEMVTRRRDDKDYLDKLELASSRGRALDVPRPTNEKARTPKPPPELDPQHRARSVDAIAERLGRIEAATTDNDRRVASARRSVRKAETSSFDKKRAAVKDAVEDAGTGQTILKLRQKPIERLIDENKIGPWERDAAAEIETAVHAIASSLMSRGISLDRVDCGKASTGGAWSDRQATAVRNYQRFAEVWSDRAAQYRDKTLQIIISAVIDERSIRLISDDAHCSRLRAERALIWGLRDYAARAGLVPNKHLAADWQGAAEQVFGWRKRLPKDADPAERAAVNAMRRMVVSE